MTEPATPLPPVDLHDALAGRAAAFVGALGSLERMDVVLWEGGVRVDLCVGGQEVALKLRPREDGGAAYATTASAEVALEVPGGAPLERGTERVVRSLLRWIEGMDHGRLVLRQLEPEVEEDAGDPDAPPPLKDADVPVARPALHLAELELSCLTDQRTTLAGWSLDDVLLVLLSAREDLPAADQAAARRRLVDEAAAAGLRRAAVGGRHVWGHPDLTELVASLARAGFQEIEVECPADAQAVRAVALAGATAVVLPADDEGTAPAVAAAREAGLAVTAWLPATAEVVEDLTARSAALEAAGAAVLLVPASVAGAASDANPLELTEAAERSALQVAGLPLCFASRRPHAPRALPTWRLAEEGTVFGVVCRFCTAQARCPGVSREHLDRWRTRGMVPMLDL